MFIRRVSLAVTFCLLFAAAVRGQHFPSNEELTARARTLVERGGSPGVVIGVLEADGTTRIVSYGTGGPGTQPLGAKSLFELGSIVKTFTAALLADMAAKGEVSLSDPVSKYLPATVRMPSKGRKITLLDLVTHHSGLPRGPEGFTPADNANPYADFTTERLYAFLASHTLRREPGAEFEYSNVGLGLLGHALERAAKKPLSDLVQERLLTPLGMHMTRERHDGADAQWLTKGHDANRNVVPYWDTGDGMRGAGGLRSNAEDMLAYLKAQVTPSETPLSRAIRSTHEQRKEISPTLGIGLAWHIRPIDGRKILFHSGGTAGSRTVVGFDPQKRVALVLLTNSPNFNDQKAFFDLLAAPAARAEITVPEAILKKYVGEYELTAERSMVITLENGQLFTQISGQQKFPLFAESESKFFLKVVDAQLVFLTHPSGAVVGAVMHQNGRQREVRKVK